MSNQKLSWFSRAREGLSKIDLVEKGYASLFILPTVIIFFTIVVVPISFGIWMSFTTRDLSGSEVTWVGLENYNNLLSRPDFWGSVKRGLVYATYSVVIQTVIGLLIALVINESFRFANIVRTIVLLPYLVPTIAVALMMGWIFNQLYGIANYYLLLLNIIETPISFFSLELAMHSVVWISGWKFTIFVVLVILARLQSIDPNLYEIATINGAGPINRFFDVTLPHLKSSLLLIILLRSVWMFNKFDMIWLLTQGGPINRTSTMVILAYQEAFGVYQFGSAAAITTMMFLILSAFGVVYFRLFSPEEEVEI